VLQETARERLGKGNWKKRSSQEKKKLRKRFTQRNRRDFLESSFLRRRNRSRKDRWTTSFPRLYKQALKLPD
jgi:hypothetical protein